MLIEVEAFNEFKDRSTESVLREFVHQIQNAGAIPGIGTVFAWSKVNPIIAELARRIDNEI